MFDATSIPFMFGIITIISYIWFNLLAYFIILLDF